MDTDAHTQTLKTLISDCQSRLRQHHSRWASIPVAQQSMKLLLLMRLIPQNVHWIRTNARSKVTITNQQTCAFMKLSCAFKVAKIFIFLEREVLRHKPSPRVPFSGVSNMQKVVSRTGQVLSLDHLAECSFQLYGTEASMAGQIHNPGTRANIFKQNPTNNSQHFAMLNVSL